MAEENTRKPVVLFLCTGNSARSQMAEAFLKKYASDRFEVLSAGMDPVGIHPLTIRVMNEVGIDMSGQYSKGVSQFLGKQVVHCAIFVCDRAEKSCPTSGRGSSTGSPGPLKTLPHAKHQKKNALKSLGRCETKSMRGSRIG
jgi:protein-tyrosine-phosphatase